MGSSCDCYGKDPNEITFVEFPQNQITKEEFLKYIPNEKKDKMENEKYFLYEHPKNAEIKTIKLENNNRIKDEMYYQGEFNNKNEKEGIGKLIIINTKKEKKYYYGIWKNDELIKGVIYYSNNITYKGDIKNYLRNGKGIYTTEKETYNGDWKDDQKDGEGLLKFKDGLEYNGQFKKDKFNGKGELKLSDGTYYKGDFCKNTFHGQGYLKGSNGHVYNGEFNMGVYNGNGEFIWAKGINSVKYKGNYSYGKKDGNGELYFDNGNIYRGGWESGSPNGEGVFETKNRKYYGNWRAGFFMQLIKSEDKENCEEENFDLNFSPPNEDIEIKDNNMNFKLSQFSGSSTNYNVNDVLVEIVKLN